MSGTLLLAVPNVSEGRRAATISAMATAFAVVGPAEGVDVEGDFGGRGARLLDVHSDADHNRSVFTLAGPPGRLADAVMAGAAVAVREVDVVKGHDGPQHERGQHPHVGAVDVAPIVYTEETLRGAACAEALVLADRLGAELEVPVFLYGELTSAEGVSARTRAELRRGGVGGLTARMLDPRRPLRPDFGPPRPHPSAGATLVAARPPLVAFNLRLAPPAGMERARAVASEIREGGGSGLPGVRAIAVLLGDGAPQVSMNIERPFDLSVVEVVEAVRRLAPVAEAELVGLAPGAALEGFPEDIPLVGFDPARHVLENALGSC